MEPTGHYVLKFPDGTFYKAGPTLEDSKVEDPLEARTWIFLSEIVKFMDQIREHAKTEEFKKLEINQVNIKVTTTSIYVHR